MGVLRSSLAGWCEESWRRRRSEEAPVCRGEVWRSMFYWLGEEDVEEEEVVL